MTAVGWLNSLQESTPDRRAGQQHVRQQQVQFAIHVSKLGALAHLVNRKIGALTGSPANNKLVSPATVLR